MNKLLIILLLNIYLYSYEKSKIDMHGGKKSNFINSSIDFTKKSIDDFLHKKSNKKNDSNKTKIKHIQIEDIEQIIKF